MLSSWSWRTAARLQFLWRGTPVWRTERMRNNHAGGLLATAKEFTGRISTRISASTDFSAATLGRDADFVTALAEYTEITMTTLTKHGIEKLTAQEIVELSKKHTISEWAVQGTVDPLPIERAEGIYL